MPGRGRKVTDTGAPPPAKDAEVRVFVEHGQGSDRRRAVFKGTLAASTTDVTITASFDSDDYDLVAAVPGGGLVTLSKTLP